jgi:hypothetical protein
MKQSRPPARQESYEQPKQMKPEAKGKKIAEEGYDLRNLQPAYFAYPFGHPGASSSISFSGSQM